MVEKIVIRSEDWLKNAGIVGLYRILKERDERADIFVEEEQISFSADLLQNFSEKYFQYFIKRYKNVLSLYRILNFTANISQYEEKNYETFHEEDLEKLNDHVEDVKKYLKSNSYRAMYPLIRCPFDPLQKERELKKVNLKKTESLKDRISDIQKLLADLKEIHDFLRQEDSQKYIGAKNVMYGIIQNAWKGISILNPQVKEQNMYLEFDKYFVQTAQEYLEQEKTKFKYRCFSCGEAIKDTRIDLSFMNHIGFDVARKTSHVWDFNNCVHICPLCRLIYACVPAGFTYLYDRGIFINANTDLEEMLRINNLVFENVWAENKDGKSLYAALVLGMLKEMNEHAEYELSDIQVVRLEKERYSFSILSRKFLNIIKKCRTDLEYIRKSSFKEGSDIYYIYNETMKRLMQGENLFLLIHKLIQLRISNSENCYYKMGTVSTIIKINDIFLKEVGYMQDEKKEYNPLERARIIGHHLQEAYGGFEEGKYNKKLDGIAYRMLNALKTNNKTAFMDSLINAHMYVQKPIPSLFSDYLNQDLVFKELGYAFVTGMLGEEWKNKDNQSKNEKEGR
ncbi:type I-B CRISPR-associated protein Cas8b1/Cst1 [Fusobacterium necrophorum]|uniref:type I-B CRISPR-associated protein Cas8b1/Cst1 n=1 Tax=Fusobacterium necrophorum TaxID=859 RepID=UPI00254F99CF|nr:type I-B CRISPR-associated protein Cas8b1/Cst1 [Fusobacterium necrophorum]MDK4522071.1 type I-B CRISPR-associated protein Cas8b1/Cst1 [Fusobacterium necrophorum]